MTLVFHAFAINGSGISFAPCAYKTMMFDRFPTIHRGLLDWFVSQEKNMKKQLNRKPCGFNIKYRVFLCVFPVMYVYSHPYH